MAASIYLYVMPEPISLASVKIVISGVGITKYWKEFLSLHQASLLYVLFDNSVLAS